MSDTKTPAPLEAGPAKSETSVEPSGPPGSPVPSNVPPDGAGSGSGGRNTRIVFDKKSSDLHGGRTRLECCLCGEDNRDNLQVEELGIAAGMRGDDYTFCYKCWNSGTLGKKILKLLHHPHGLKLIDSMVESVEVEQ